MAIGHRLTTWIKLPFFFCLAQSTVSTQNMQITNNFWNVAKHYFLHMENTIIAIFSGIFRFFSLLLKLSTEISIIISTWFCWFRLAVLFTVYIDGKVLYFRLRSTQTQKRTLAKNLLNTEFLLLFIFCIEWERSFSPFIFTKLSL